MSKSFLQHIKVNSLWLDALGTTEKHHFEEDTLDLSDQFTLTAPLIGDLLMIKMKEEISVIVSDFNTSVELKCTKCLKEFDLNIEIPSMERSFLLDPPTFSEDPFDLFYIDKKSMTIDLSDMLRQEIILHFPFIPVCSSRGKGLCSECGKDLNKKEGHSPNCSHKNTTTKGKGNSHDSDEAPPNTYKPFANLKDLLK